MSSVAGEECQRAAGPMRGCARSGGTPLDENTHTCRKNGGSGLERKSADPEEEEEEEYRGQKKGGVSSSSLLYLVLYLTQREEWRKRAGRRGAWSATPPRRQPEQ